MYWPGISCAPAAVGVAAAANVPATSASVRRDTCTSYSPVGLASRGVVSPRAPPSKARCQNAVLDREGADRVRCDCLDRWVRLGRDFGWLWAAFAVSTAGTFLAFDAFPLIAILVLRRGAGGGLAARRGGPGGRRGGGGPARPVGGVPAQAPGDGRDGPDPLRGIADVPCRLRARLADVLAAARRGDRRRRVRHRVPGGERGVREGARSAFAAAGRVVALRVDDVDGDGARSAARRGVDRRVRAADDGRRQRGQLPALGGRDPGDRGLGAAARSGRAASAAGCSRAGGSSCPAPPCARSS